MNSGCRLAASSGAGMLDSQPDDKSESVIGAAFPRIAVLRLRRPQEPNYAV
jgi:hypothetical protein